MRCSRTTGPLRLTALAAAAALLGGVPTLSAQRMDQLRTGLSPEPPPAASVPKLDRRRFESHTYWKAGGVLGGAVTLAYGMLIFFDARDEPNGPSLLMLPPAAAISFLVGFGPGALLGSLIPKPSNGTSSQ